MGLAGRPADDVIEPIALRHLLANGPLDYGAYVLDCGRFDGAHLSDLVATSPSASLSKIQETRFEGARGATARGANSGSREGTRRSS